MARRRPRWPRIELPTEAVIEAGAEGWKAFCRHHTPLEWLMVRVLALKRRADGLDNQQLCEAETGGALWDR